MRRLTIIAVASAVLTVAAVAAGPAQQLSLTVYNSNLALVQDTRVIDIAAGRTQVEFKNVSVQIRPETVALNAKGLSVVEQNFDYDLLTPAKMMEKAVGKQIKIVRTNPATGQETTQLATVLSVNGGVVLKVGDKIEVLRDDGIPTRVVFSSIPENLRASPTLSVTVDSAAAGPHEATLSYLTTGLSWKADYVALFDEAKGVLRLQGWVTLNNRSGITYQNAKTQLVAGTMEISNDYDSYIQRARSNSTRRTGTFPAGEKGVADYMLYDLPERVTVADNQTKQVSFLDLSGIKAAKTYEYRVDDFASGSQPEHADSVVSFSNRERALPKGVVRVYMRDGASEAKFLGENAINHTPGGSELAVKIGEAFDVTAERTLVSSERTFSNHTRYSLSVVFRNAKPVPVTVEFRQSGMWRDGEVEKESQKSRRIDAYTVGWPVAVPANGETTLTYTVDPGY